MGVRRGPPYPLSRSKGTRSYKPTRSNSKQIASPDSLGGIETLFTVAAVSAPVVISLINNKMASKKVRELSEMGSRAVKDLMGTQLPLKKNPSGNSEKDVLQDLKDCNPDKGGLNCVGCTLAFDLRRRGFDVSAKADYDPKYMIDTVYKEFYKDYKLKKHTDLSKMTTKMALKTAMDRLSEYPDGARGGFACTFRPEYIANFGCSGHQMGWIKVSGKVNLVDPQTGRIIDSSNDLFKLIEQASEPGGFRSSRLDNLELKPGIGTAMRNMIGTPSGRKSSSDSSTSQSAALDILDDKKR